MPLFTLHRGDCVEVMRSIPDNSIDSIVTDPPYGLEFMGQRWDYDVPSVDVWREALRVLKPGGHLLSFASARTYHRMAVNIEDAGFEIRDQLMWLYGSGFPKSRDISKAIDIEAGFEPKVVAVNPTAFRKNAERNHKSGQVATLGLKAEGSALVTEPTTTAAKRWFGWGTALKPAHEPIVLARKPISQSTIAANVLVHGVGGVNIDACRIPLENELDAATFASNHMVTERLPEYYDGTPLGLHNGGWKQRVGKAAIPTGRWPANVLHDGSDDVLAHFPTTQSGVGAVKRKSGKGYQPNALGTESRPVGQEMVSYGDAGSAARFFYCGKATRQDRDQGCDLMDDRVLARSTQAQAQAEAKRGNVVDGGEGAFNLARLRKNNHPTVKPTSVCLWMLRLVTPPGGVTLDMYCGSGSFGKAAMLGGFEYIGIDRDADEYGEPLGYLDIARARILDAQIRAFDEQMVDDEL